MQRAPALQTSRSMDTLENSAGRTYEGERDMHRVHPRGSLRGDWSVNRKCIEGPRGAWFLETCPNQKGEGVW